MNKIQAVRIVREVSSLGLLESKNLVERITPLLQMTSQERVSRKQHLESLIYDFRVGHMSTLDSDLLRLQTMIEEYKGYI